MGCGQTKENLEAEMLLLQLMRTEIQDERKIILKKLEDLSGKKIIRPKIPEYVASSPKSKSPKRKKKHSEEKHKKKSLKNKQSTCDDEESNNDESSIEEVNLN